MFDDDDAPPPLKYQPTQRDLTTLSVEELDTYTAWLKEEIERVQADKARKMAASSAASLFFKA